MTKRVLAINPGSTSTKIAVFDDKKEVFTKTLRHNPEEIDKFSGIIEQFEFRKELVLEAIKENDVDPKTLDAAVGRGGLVRSVSGGTYKVNEKMLADLKNPELWGRVHASSLGAYIANSLSQEYDIPAFIADPVTVDEFHEVARVSGIPEIERKSLFHALNLRYIARDLAKKLDKKFEECNFIGVHMGGGISIAPFKKGKAVDVNNALLGMGAFSPQRAGALPIGDLIDMAFSGDYTKKELNGYLAKNAGWKAYLGTDSGIEVSKRIEEGDKKAKLIHDAMCYQVSKEIGASAAVLEGKVDAIFLTGGLSYGKGIVSEISKHVEFIAPIHVYPGEKEMEALTQAGVRVLNGEEDAKEY